MTLHCLPGTKIQKEWNILRNSIWPPILEPFQARRMGQRERTVDRVLTLHAADLCLILGTRVYSES